jgi:hypothetical protein
MTMKIDERLNQIDDTILEMGYRVKECLNFL